MQSKVASFAATPDPTFGQAQPNAPTAQGGKAKGSSIPTSDPADLRLVIEEDQASGSYIYKTVNRRTGEIVLQLPRAEVLRMREETAYAAGSVIRAKA